MPSQSERLTANDPCFQFAIDNYVGPIISLRNEVRRGEVENPVDNRLTQLSLLSDYIGFVDQNWDSFSRQPKLLQTLINWRRDVLKNLGIANPAPLSWENQFKELVATGNALTQEVKSDDQISQSDITRQALTRQQIEAQQLEEQRQRLMQEAGMDNLAAAQRIGGEGSSGLNGYGSTSSEYEERNIRAATIAYLKDPRLAVSDLLFFLGNPSQLEYSRMSPAFDRDPGMRKKYLSFLEAVNKFRGFNRDNISMALGKMEDTARKVENAAIHTHDMDQMIRKRFESTITTADGRTRKFSLSVGDMMSKMELRKYKQGLMDNDIDVREATKEQIILDLIAEKTNLSTEDVRNFKNSNLYSPSLVDKDEIKTGRFDLVGTFHKPKVKTYEDLQLLMRGFTDRAETMLILTGRSFLLDPLMKGFVDYKERGVLALFTYWSTYNVGPAGMKPYLSNEYGSIYGTDLKSTHPLLMKKYGVGNNLNAEALKQLNWILRVYRNKNQFKIAEDVIGTGQKDFYDPVSGDSISLKSEKERLKFLQDHHESFGDRAAEDISVQKFDGLRQILGQRKFQNLWQGVNFRPALVAAMKSNGLDEQQIQSELNSCDNGVGANALELFIKKYNNFNTLEYNNSENATTNFGKWFRYLAGVEAANPLFLQVFNNMNIFSPSSTSLDAMVEEVTSSARLTMQAMSELGSRYGHYSDTDRYNLIEGMISAMIDMAGDKHNAHRFKVDINPSGGDNQFDLNYRDMDEDTLRRRGLDKFGWYVEHGKLVNGWDPVVTAEKGDKSTLAKQYNSSHLPKAYFEAMIKALIDSQMLNAPAAERLKNKFSNQFNTHLFSNAIKEEISIDSEALGGFLPKIGEVLSDMAKDYFN